MNYKLGAIVIGRNEGERLRRCLESMVLSCDRLVYVDSNSSDNSVELARSLGVEVLELDLSRPFTAARARHEGYLRLMALYPDTEILFFVDGDCEVFENWIALALAVLNDRPNIAVICGRLRERHPEQSVYNRMCELEWDMPVGEATSCGGISCMREQAYRQVGGFDPSVPAGEEPELCDRLRKAGWKILRIDADMAWHDAAITKFWQWWRREFRTGYGGLDVQRRFGLQDFASINRSARIWTVGWLLAMVGVGTFGWFLVNGSFAIKAAGLMFLLLPVQMLRVAWKGWRRGLAVWDSLAYGGLVMVSKWPQILGQLKNIREINLVKRASLTEYMTVHASEFAWLADLKRYPPRPWLSEQSIWAIAVHRFGRRMDRRPPGFKKQLMTLFYWRLFRLVETVTSISLPKEAEIGPGLRIHHFGNIFIHPDVRIGANCTLRQGVTIGNRVPDGPVPVIGNDVEFGAYAQVLGGVTVGDRAKIGAMSVVLTDVPTGATAVGNPARIVRSVNINQE
jgi:serine acetyltransferase